MRRRRLYRLLPALAAIGFAVAAYGKVYRRWDTSGNTFPIEHLGARTAYSAPVRVNGGKADLKVLAWTDDYESVVDDLRATYFHGKDDTFIEGRGMACGIMRSGGNVVRMLVTDIDGQCIAFRMEQSEGEFARSCEPLRNHQLTQITPYPDSDPALFIANEDTHTSMEVSVADADPGTVQSFIESTLESDGWRSSPPARSAGMSIYTRGADVCLMLVTPGDRGMNSARITLLHMENSTTKDTAH
jgi:hypothetical protein